MDNLTLGARFNIALRKAGFVNMDARVDSTTWDDGSASVEVVVHQRAEFEDRVEYDYVWSATYLAWPTVDDVVAWFVDGLTLTRALRPWLNLSQAPES